MLHLYLIPTAGNASPGQKRKSVLGHLAKNVSSAALVDWLTTRGNSSPCPFPGYGCLVCQFNVNTGTRDRNETGAYFFRMIKSNLHLQ